MEASSISLFDNFKEHILSSREVARQGLEVLEDWMDGDYIKQNFSELVIRSQERAYNVFLESQRESWSRAIGVYIENRIANDITRDDLVEFLVEHFDELDSFFLSLTNSRRPRAGLSFQYAIKELFIRIGYPFEEHADINGKPDFLLPNLAHFQENAMDCIIFTIKRSLRERWRQITTEGTRALGFFLGTIDEELSETALREMSVNRIHVVVPIDLKDNIDVYSEAQNVLSFESFFEDYLDPAFRRWRRRGII